MINDKITIPVSAAELIDKITILEIKLKRIKNEASLNFVKNELRRLRQIRNIYMHETPKIRALTKSLRQTNIKIWEIEDKIRQFERNKDYNSEFVKIARLVYINNDKRSEIKRKINLLLGSEIMEQKSYPKYQDK